MKIESAELIVGSEPVVVVKTDVGDVWIYSPKTTLAAIGIVLIQGPAVESGAVKTITLSLPPAPADGRWEAVEFPDATDDLQLIEMGRRLAADLYMVPGPVNVPTFEEADSAQWGLVGERLQKLA